MSGDLQHTAEWHAERLGKITASRIDDVLAKPRKGGETSRTRENYKAHLMLERLTGKPREEFNSWDMQRGVEMEPLARAAYEDALGVMVEAVGFVEHPKIPMAGCSPDGFVGEEGMVQFKAPKAATHFEWLSKGGVPMEHRKQMAFELACCPDRKWNDFVSYHPDMPEHLRLFVTRYHREDIFIAEIEAEVAKFDAEIEEAIRHLPNGKTLQVNLEQSIHVVNNQKRLESLEISEEDAQTLLNTQAEIDRRRAEQPVKLRDKDLSQVTEGVKVPNF